MCTIKFSIELYAFQIDDKDQTTSNNCEKSTQIFNVDDTLVSHPSGYVSFWMTRQ